MNSEIQEKSSKSLIIADRFCSCQSRDSMKENNWGSAVMQCHKIMFQKFLKNCFNIFFWKTVSKMIGKNFDREKS